MKKLTRLLTCMALLTVLANTVLYAAPKYDPAPHPQVIGYKPSPFDKKQEPIDNDLVEPVKEAHELSTNVWYKIRNVNSGKYLTVQNAGGSGSNLEQWQKLNADHQLFRIVSNGDNYYRIISKVNNCSIDFENANDTPGTNLRLWTSNRSSAQKINILWADKVSHYIISSKGFAFDVANASKANGANIGLWKLHGGYCQRYVFEPVK